MKVTTPETQSFEVLKELAQKEEERGTIVHCVYIDPDVNSGVRIWPQTVLIQNDGTRCKLIKAINISIVPEWTYFSGSHARFTLLFEALTAVCTSFHLLEDIPEPGGLTSGEIPRNQTDVYHIEVF